MKKTSHLPNFHKLFSEKREKTWQFYLSQLIFFFFFGSVCGFLWEVSIFLVKEGVFRKRGFLYGPWLPIYGVGAVVFYLVLGFPFSHNPHSSAGSYFSSVFSSDIPAAATLFPNSRTYRRNKKILPLLVFLLSAFLGGGIELISGWILDTFWGLRYWDYHGTLLNFHGYICLWSVLGFGIAGTLWICYVSKLITKLWLHIPARIRYGSNTILVLLFLTDCAAALIFPNQGYGITF